MLHHEVFILLNELQKTVCFKTVLILKESHIISFKVWTSFAWACFHLKPLQILILFSVIHKLCNWIGWKKITMLQSSLNKLNSLREVSNAFVHSFVDIVSSSGGFVLLGAFWIR